MLLCWCLSGTLPHGGCWSRRMRCISLTVWWIECGSPGRIPHFSSRASLPVAAQSSLQTGRLLPSGWTSQHPDRKAPSAKDNDVSKGVAAFALPAPACDAPYTLRPLLIQTRRRRTTPSVLPHPHPYFTPPQSPDSIRAQPRYDPVHTPRFTNPIHYDQY